MVFYCCRNDNDDFLYEGSPCGSYTSSASNINVDCKCIARECITNHSLVFQYIDHNLVGYKYRFGSGEWGKSKWYFSYHTGANNSDNLFCYSFRTRWFSDQTNNSSYLV